ncbi:MAG: dicarboxylate/amino acid:cation symporter, partial [Planctomycetota bacterium]
MGAIAGRLSLTHWILLAMIAGGVLGWLMPEASQSLKPFSGIFLKLIKSLIAPLVFATLVIGIAGHGDDMRRVGRLALKSIIYFEVVTTLALLIGLVAVNLTRPGEGIKLEAPESSAMATVQASSAKQATWGQVLEHIVPNSIIDAMARNEVLQIVCWSILFALALAGAPLPAREAILPALDALAQVMFRLTGIVMAYAPIGIGAAIAVTVGHSGVQVLWNLALLILTLY